MVVAAGPVIIGGTAASAKGHALSGERGSPRRGDRLHLRSEPADRVADQLGCDHQDQHAHDRGVVPHHPASALLINRATQQSTVRSIDQRYRVIVGLNCLYHP